MNDPQVIKFCNEQIRPLCEEARAFKARIAAMTTDWFAGINVKVPNDSTTLDDARVQDGVSVLTGADITNAVGNLISAHDALNDQIVAKPCVRAFAAQ